MRAQVIRSGNTGFANTSSVEVIGNGVGQENTLEVGDFNTVVLTVEWTKGGTTATPTLRPYWSFDGKLFLPLAFVAENNAMTIPATSQTITFPNVNFNWTFEIFARASYFRLGFTCNDGAMTTASCTIRGEPRLR